MTLLTLLQSQAATAAVQANALLGGGGWDAREFTRLRRSLAKRKKRLCEEVREIIAEAAPVAAAIDAAPLAPEPDTLELLIAEVHAQLHVIEMAVTQQALTDVAVRIEALRQEIEDEIEDEEALLLLAT